MFMRIVHKRLHSHGGPAARLSKRKRTGEGQTSHGDRMSERTAASSSVDTYSRRISWEEVAPGCRIIGRCAVSCCAPSWVSDRSCVIRPHATADPPPPAKAWCAARI
jgi:hypothetical protein